MTSAHFHGHGRPQPGRGRAMRHPGRRARGQRLIAPDEIALFSERLDNERDYENTVRDFVQLHDLAHSADLYDS